MPPLSTVLPDQVRDDANPGAGEQSQADAREVLLSPFPTSLSGPAECPRGPLSKGALAESASPSGGPAPLPGPTWTQLGAEEPTLLGGSLSRTRAKGPLASRPPCVPPAGSQASQGLGVLIVNKELRRIVTRPHLPCRSV